MAAIAYSGAGQVFFSDETEDTTAKRDAPVAADKVERLPRRLIDRTLANRGRQAKAIAKRRAARKARR